MILACVGEDLEGAPAARVQQILRHGVDWKRLTHLAQQHGLVPILYRRLSTAVDLSQSALMQTLRQQDEANARRTLWLTLELLNIHKHLVARGLEVLPYKGPVLAHRLYGNVAPRQFSDLGLLVRAHDLTRIKAAMAELGYAPGLGLTPATAGVSDQDTSTHLTALVGETWLRSSGRFCRSFTPSASMPMISSRGLLWSPWRARTCARCVIRNLCWCFAFTPRNMSGCNSPGYVTLCTSLGLERSTGML